MIVVKNGAGGIVPGNKRLPPVTQNVGFLHGPPNGSFSSQHGNTRMRSGSLFCTIFHTLTAVREALKKGYAKICQNGVTFKTLFSIATVVEAPKQVKLEQVKPKL